MSMVNTSLRDMMSGRKLQSILPFTFGRQAHMRCRCIYSIQHSEAYFPDPHSFRLDRWIPNQMLSQEQIDHGRRALNNFSLGMRGCAGQAMAHYQITVTAARVIYEFDFRHAQNDLAANETDVSITKTGQHQHGEVQLSTCFTSIVNGPMVEFSPR